MGPNLKTAKLLWRQWQAPVVGLAIGLAYGVFSQQIDFEAVHAPKAFIWISNVVSVLLEGVWGILAGFAFNYIRSQRRINRALSTENAKLQRHLLTQMLSAHILHEIRTPLHNMTALLDDWQRGPTPEEVGILQRNLNRLQTVTNQLSRWTGVDEEIDVREPVLFDPWLDEFIVDKVQSRLYQHDIRLERQIDRVVVQMHPLLLEQCFTTIFNNALEAVMRGRGPRLIRLMAKCSSDRLGYVEVQIRNSGEPYPDAVLVAQGKEPVESTYGSGLGLMLARNSLELIGGSIQFSNEDRQATTNLLIPGHNA